MSWKCAVTGSVCYMALSFRYHILLNKNCYRAGRLLSGGAGEYQRMCGRSHSLAEKIYQLPGGHHELQNRDS